MQKPPATSPRIADAVKDRLGSLPLLGRYHRLPRQIEDDYVLGRVLGSGYNGDVRKATRKNATGRGGYFAVKKFKLGGLSPKQVSSLESEAQIYLCMDHPHIVRLVNVYETPEMISLVMEGCEGGELFERVKAKGQLPEGQVARLARQMLLAVHYLHSHGIAHRDLKLENFLFDQPDRELLKLIDFGFSRFYEGRGPVLRRMKTACGTLSYVAPEVLADTYTSQCDLWSLGVIVFISISGCMPFHGNSSAQKKSIAAGRFSMKTGRWSLVSEACRQFVKSLLEVNPRDRLTAKQALDHVWIQEYASTVTPDSSFSLLRAFQTYTAAPKFRQCCLLAMAWLLPSRETSRMQAEFLAIDTDQQGTISLAELQDVMVKMHGVSESDVTEMFNAMDANHDDEIHYSEFLAAMLSTRVDPKSAHVGNAFRNFDKDLSGYITADNLRDVFGNTFEGKRVESLLHEADFLGDGYISFDEFVAFVCDLPFERHAFATRKDMDEPYTPKHYTMSSSDKIQMQGGHEAQMLSRIYPGVSEARAVPTEKCCTIM